jgi:hypothetical protein
MNQDAARRRYAKCRSHLCLCCSALGAAISCAAGLPFRLGRRSLTIQLLDQLCNAG